MKHLTNTCSNTKYLFGKSRAREREKTKLRHHVTSTVSTLINHVCRPISAREIALLLQKKNYLNDNNISPH